MTTLYGIKNCDTVKKAKKWLDDNEKDYIFHDFRSDGLDISAINKWLKSVPQDKLVNKRSATWKQLSDQEKALFESDVLTLEAKQLILGKPTLIKRPVLADNESVTVGFKESEYLSFFN